MPEGPVLDVRQQAHAVGLGVGGHYRGRIEAGELQPGLKNHFLNNFSPARSLNAPLNGSDGRVLIGGDIVHD